MSNSLEAAQWLRHAILLAEENVKGGHGGPFGAVITRDGAPVAEGVNLVTASCDPTAHAEVTAIRRAATQLGTYDLRGCVLYSSCEPCPMCLGAILWARLDAVWYAADQQQAAAAGFDDSHFYEQLRLPPGERAIPMRQACQADGQRPFDAWLTFSDKVLY